MAGLLLFPVLASAQVEQDFPLGNSGETITMVYVEPGSFMMGAQPDDINAQADEHPQHPVTLTRGYWIGKYELTQAQWTAVLGDWPYWFPGENHPAEMMSWNDIHDSFLPALNVGLNAPQWRLPTEAEWVYAACAGRDSTRFWWGDDWDWEQLGTYAWYWDNNTPFGTKPVGLKQPNPWGLYDTAGNVWEFVSDWYRPDYYASSPEIDPPGPFNGRVHPIRGGAWRSPVQNIRTADRGTRIPHQIRYCTGLRLVYDPEAVPADFVLEMTPANLTVPSTGGPLEFTVTLTNNTAHVQQVIGWTEAISQQGVQFYPLLQRSLNLQPGSVTFTGLVQDIPANAPAGSYTFVARLSIQSLPNVQAWDSYEFQKEE
ncbi:formylglycine-generating enzyme family protein [bacterium]|nr:formylglycine-generating enzyme family protein [bacterium]